MEFRLVAYEPLGEPRDILPDALEILPVVSLSDPATLQIQYPKSGVNASILQERIHEMALQYYDEESGRWVEPANCRFLSMKGENDFLDDTPTFAVDYVHVGSFQLQRATVWSTDGLREDEDGKAQFLSATAGQILGPLLQRAKDRGWGAGIDWDFTATKDSAGADFAHIITIAYDTEINLNTILTNLRDQQVIDFRWNGRTLQLFNPGTVMARETDLQLVAPHGHTAAPEEWSNEELQSHVRVIGEDGMSWEFSNDVLTPLGRLEGVVTQGGVSDPGTAEMLSREGLVAGEDTRVARTREFDVLQGSPAPFRDYVPGDWVHVLSDAGEWEYLRVHSISVTVNDEGVSGHAVLGDSLDDLLSRIAKRTQGIAGGATVGGSGVRPNTDGPDRREPAVPEGLVGSTDFYFDDQGVPRGVVWFEWAAVFQATNGTGIDVNEYWIEITDDYVGAPVLLTRSTSEPFFSHSPMDIYDSDGNPRRYKARVRARANSGVLGDWSEFIAVEMVEDPDPPPPPLLQPGDITTTLGTVRVDITGVDHNHNPQPGDFSHFKLYESTSPSGGWQLVASRAGTEPGFLWQSGHRPAGVEMFYRLTAVDISGNESSPSAVQSITPSKLTDNPDFQEAIEQAGEDLEELERNLENRFPIENDDIVSIEGGKVTAPEAIVNDAFVQRVWADGIYANTATLARAVFASRNLWPDPEFEVAKFNGWETIDGGIERNGTGALAGGYDTEVVIPTRAGDTFYISADLTFLEGTGESRIRVRSYDEEGEYVSGSTDNTVIGEADGRWGGEYTVYEDGVFLAVGFWTESSAGTGTRVRWENLRIQNMVDGTLIEGGSVMTRHLQADAVTADKIKAGAVEAEHIDAHAIDGKVITGALIQTRSHAKRGVKQTDDGIVAFDSSGSQTVNIDGTNNYMHGRFYTNGPGEPGILLNPARSTQGPGVWFSEDGSASSNWAAIWTSVDSNGYFHTLNIRPRKGTGGPGVVKLHGTTNAGHLSVDSFYTTGGISVDKSSFLQRDVYLNGLGGLTEIAGRLNAYGPHYLYNLPTTSGWSPLRVSTSSGLVYMYSSLQEVKINAEKVDSATHRNILQLDPKIWYDRTDLQEKLEDLGLDEELFVYDTDDGPIMDVPTVEGVLGDDMPMRVAGLIAEDVVDAGLEDFAEYRWDSENEEYQLQGVAYDRLWTLLIPLVREQDKRIASLEEENKSLRDRLQAIEDRLSNLE